MDTSRVNEADLYFGEALYYAYQDDYYDAITRQNIAVGKIFGPSKINIDPVNFQYGAPKFFGIDYELSYRMYPRAVQSYWEISEANADPSVRNETAFRLARVYMQLDDPGNALKILNKITGNIPKDIQDDVNYLRAQIYMSIGKFEDAASSLESLKDSKSYKGFAFYNLGVAYINSVQEQLGLNYLERAGDISGEDEVASSIRDKANLALGYRLLDSNKPERARKYLDLVRLDGPFSNKALLGAGLAEVAQGRFDRALTPWTVLSKRDVTDNSVQESMLGVPYAYAQLNLPGKAALLCGSALEVFDRELTRLDESIKSVSEGKFLPALLREELKPEGNWITKLIPLADVPETRYLLKMMTSDEFRRALKNYLDLEEMSKKMESGDKSLNAFEGMISLRPQYYKPLGYDDQLRKLKSRLPAARMKISGLLAKQGDVLEILAVKHLNLRRKFLQENQAQAKLALVENYERAKKQARTSGGQ